MRGAPDWGRPVERAAARLYAPFETDGPPLAMPDTLSVATEPGGSPAFQILAVRDFGPDGAGGHGRLDFELALGVADADARLAPALRGWLRLRSSMLDLPEGLRAPIELDCSGLGLARLTLPLAAEGVTFVERAVAEGALPVLAAVDVEVAGVAPRPGGKAEIDLAKLGAALAGGDVTPAALRDALLADAAAVGVALVDVPDATVAVAEAVVDHVRARLCAGPLRPAGDAGLALAPLDPAVASGRATLDLRLAVVATRAFALALDPFAAARALAEGAGGIASLVRRVTGTPLPTGRRRVTVDAGLRRPLAGPLMLGGILTFPPRPPGRPFEIRRDFELPTDGTGVEQAVELAPSEPLEWTLAGFACWPTTDGRGVEQLTGPALSGAGAHALLRPSAFPLAFIDVEAAPAVLALAEALVAVEGSRGGRPARAKARLSAAHPRVTLALPVDVEAPQLAVELTPPGGGPALALPLRPAADWRVELADVPGYGARAVEIAVTLPQGVALAAIEVLAEDAETGTEPAVYSFTAETGVRIHRWFCRDPFRPRLLWRWCGAETFAAAAADRLDLTPRGSRRMTDALPGNTYGRLRAWPEPGGASPATRWRYLPAAPSPQRTPAGTPQVTMIEAGGVLMLTVGAALGADEPTLAAAQTQIAAEAGVAPDAVELRPAEIAVQRAVLEFAPATGPARVLAQAAPSPVPPYPAAFSAMLQGDAAAETKAALASGAGRVQVRYEVRLTADRTVTARVEGDWEDNADVEALLAQGRLALATEAEAGVSDALVAAVRTEAVRAAQASIARMASGPDPGAPVNRGSVAVARHGVAASVTRSEPSAQALDLAADVGDWI